MFPKQVHFQDPVTAFRPIVGAQSILQESNIHRHNPMFQSSNCSQTVSTARELFLSRKGLLSVWSIIDECPSTY